MRRVNHPSGKYDAASSSEKAASPKRGCGSSVTSRCWASLHFDFYLFGFRLFPLWQRETQHAVLELRVDRFAVHIGRKRKRSIELTVASLYTMVILTLFFVFHTPFAAYREGVLIEVDLNIVAAYLGQLNFDQEGILILVHIHCRRPRF